MIYNYTFTDSGTFIDLYLALGITTGESIIIQNNTRSYVYIVKGGALPTTEGHVLYPQDSLRIQGVAGSRVWVKGDSGDIAVQLQHQADGPFGLVDLPASRYTSNQEGFSRLQVDVGQTGFFEGREFRVVRKVTVTAGTPFTYKFTSAVDFILFEQSVSATEGDLEYYVWRASNVTENTPFNTVVPVFGKNNSSEYRLYGGLRYVTATTITTGGTITVTNPDLYADYDRAKTSGATAQQVTVGGSPESARYLAAGTYYLQFTSLSGTSIGRFDIAWEERASS